MKTLKNLNDAISNLNALATAWDIMYDSTLHTNDIKYYIDELKNLYKDAKKYGYSFSYCTGWRAQGVEHENINWWTTNVSHESAIKMVVAINFDATEKTLTIDCKKA